MTQAKHQAQSTSEEAFNEVSEGESIFSGNPSLLIAACNAMKKADEKPLNDIERQSVLSLISYVAYTQSVCETTVASILTANFGVDDVNALPSRLYQQMIEFLVDLEVGKDVN